MHISQSNQTVLIWDIKNLNPLTNLTPELPLSISFQFSGALFQREVVKVYIPPVSLLRPSDLSIFNLDENPRDSLDKKLYVSAISTHMFTGPIFSYKSLL
jgi:hypothetical protein